ncbi:GM25492 [Drosophila sechellia]|uniref:GM25492 n=1 Tax=Drosophila sechellia TaxID=7238 RepID=B4HHV1_DROSE|nr:GM25492 [Drosophila sechellia]
MFKNEALFRDTKIFAAQITSTRRAPQLNDRHISDELAKQTQLKSKTITGSPREGRQCAVPTPRIRLGPGG